MPVLAFDTSTPAVTVAVVEGDVVLAEAVRIEANRHGELLAPLIADTLLSAGVTGAQLTGIAVGVGPGPFTGLRVGLVTARALGDAWGIRVTGAGSLDALAWPMFRDGSAFAVASDARRREVYWARYSAASGRSGVRVEGPSVDSPATVMARLEPHETVHGAGAALHRDVFGDAVAEGGSPYPLARHVARLAADPRWALPVQPLYLRRPDAQPGVRPKKVTPA